jgi:NAD(P)-dependent dehydrogenase (short-subunit alcohol dehydrogenase family)
MMDRLVGRRALVTGAAQGIGEGIAHRLAAEGAAVAVTDVNVAGGQAVADAIGGDATFFALDVTVEQDWIDGVAMAVDRLGGLDILVNNAGMGSTETLEECSLAQYEKTIAVTQTSVFLGMKHAGEALKRSGHGSVINISSIFGASGGLGTSPDYHAAKGAVRLMTKNVALLWATEGVRVNSVHPGFIDTPLFDQVRGTEMETAIVATTPMGRLGLPAEVAAAVAFLASDDATFCTGSELYVDGGYMAR